MEFLWINEIAGKYRQSDAWNLLNYWIQHFRIAEVLTILQEILVGVSDHRTLIYPPRMIPTTCKLLIVIGTKHCKSC